MPWVVDCIIPCYNNAATVTRAVRSVLEQDVGDGVLTLILVDDGSSDDSVAQVRAIGDSRVTIVRQPNAGPAAARNTGVRAGRAPFCAFLDADDVWRPGKLRLQVAALLAADDSCVGGHCVSFLQRRACGRRIVRTMPAPERFADATMDVCMTTLGSTMLARRAMFDAVGLFDEGLRCFEDWDWQLRCLLKGFRFDTSPQVLVEKYEGGRRSGAVVEVSAALLRRRLPEVRTAFGARAARRLASALYFEIALSDALRRDWAGCIVNSVRCLGANPRRLGLLARQAARRIPGRSGVWLGDARM